MAWGSDRPRMPAGWRRQRREVLRESCVCYRCGGVATEVDHVVGRHRGGGEGANLKPICRDCHAVKSAAEGHAVRAELRRLRRRPVGRHPGAL